MSRRANPQNRHDSDHSSAQLGAVQRQNQRKALPVCQKCQSYKMTWDSRQPHACLFFGFQSYQLPSVEVYNSTGLACPQYRLSQNHAKQAAESQRRFQDRLAKETPIGPIGPIGPNYSSDGQLLAPEGENYQMDHDLIEIRQNPEQSPNQVNRQRSSLGKDLGCILGEKGILL